MKYAVPAPLESGINHASLQGNIDIIHKLDPAG